MWAGLYSPGSRTSISASGAGGSRSLASPAALISRAMSGPPWRGARFRCVAPDYRISPPAPTGREELMRQPLVPLGPGLLAAPLLFTPALPAHAAPEGTMTWGGQLT